MFVLRYIFCAVLAATLSVLPFNLFAMSIDAQNKLYKDAFSALRSGKVKQFETLKARLKPTAYPLYDYLEFEKLKMDILQKRVNQTEIDVFLAAQHGTVLEKRLREFWLGKLANEKTTQNDTIFLREYRNLGDIAMQCTALTVRLRNRDSTALDEIKSIWLYGKSRPDSCNQPIAAWIKAGRLTKPLVWERIELAVLAKEYGLASHLRKYLPHNEQAYVNTWLSVARDPQLITSARLFANTHGALRNIQVYGLARLARRDAVIAQKAFNKINKPGYFTEAEKQRIYGAIALELATEHHPEATIWYAKLKPEFFTPAMHEWRVRHALWHGDWKNVITYVNNMPADLKKDSTWVYWQARGFMQTGKPELAQPLLNTVSKERLFQGFFASDLFNAPYPLHLPTPTVMQTDIQKAKTNRGIARAVEFYRLKQIDAARIEWDYAARNMSEIGMQAAATIAYNMGWYDRAIFTLSRAENRNNTTIRFPIVYKDSVLREAKKQSLSPAWVFAIARRESAFMPDAKSPVGALGLMQLMPLTAKQLSRKLREPYLSPQQLLNATKNLHLGTAYLNELYKSLGQNIVLATAAYNAGPHRVYQWMPPENVSMDPDIWIENIPFYETREYVKNVLIYRMIYEYKLNQKTQRLKSFLKPIQR